jgi:hypothetical protein
MNIVVRYITGFISMTILAGAICHADAKAFADNGNAKPSENTVMPPAGLYVGYYQEDPTANPEDPTIGAFSLNLPEKGDQFSGSMYFTYVGCQTTNVGTVAGVRKGMSLSGTWSGKLDGSPQSGTYKGEYDASQSVYSGTFLNDKGKQFRDLRPCIQYWISPKGTWEMFAVDTKNPGSFTININSHLISWAPVKNAAYALVYILDPVIALGSGNPVVWQTMAMGAASQSIPKTVKLQAGKEYIAVIAVANARFKRVAFGSTRFKP